MRFGSVDDLRSVYRPPGRGAVDKVIHRLDHHCADFIAKSPFFVLSTSAPLLQRWFFALGAPRARDPYFLYAASNAGSMLALLAYPVVLEPLVGLRRQTELWALG